MAVGAGAYVVTRKDGGATSGVAAPPRATTSTSSTTTTTLRDPLRGNGQPVTFAFGGDTMFEGNLRSKLLKDPNGLLAPIAPVLSSADVAVVNLETSITEGGAAVPKKYNFRVPGAAIDALRAAGVDTASMANNHGLDFGLSGLADTIANGVAKQFPLIGIGNDSAGAYTPYFVEVRGQRIAVIAATDVLDGEYIASWTAGPTKPGLASAKDLNVLVPVVQAWRAKVDTVVVFLHWGVERQGCPSPRQQEVANALTAAGADIVVGSHAHQLQGGGRLGTAFVDYGLGNFVFYNETGEYGRTGVLLVTATGRTIDSYQWVPARIRGGVPTPLPPGPEADAELAHWNELRGCTGLAA